MESGLPRTAHKSKSECGSGKEVGYEKTFRGCTLSPGEEHRSSHGKDGPWKEKLSGTGYVKVLRELKQDRENCKNDGWTESKC